MTDRLPLFTLGTVLFPGLVLPLHIFEERYRALVRDRSDAGMFGVVAIKRGWEVGDSSSVELHDIGCTAEIRQITEHSDGRYDLVTVGRRRFRVTGVHTDVAPYLVGDIEWIDPAPEPGDATVTTPARVETDDDKLVPGLLEQFQRYLELLRTDGNPAFEQMPDDPGVLSYLIAATAMLTVDDRQQLLGCRTTRERMLAERRMLGRETALLREVRAVPAPLNDFATPPSPN
jgi:Lon protease-like protein